MPAEIKDLVDKILRDPARVSVTPTSSTSELIDQSVYYVDRTNKRHLLMHVLANPDVKRAIVFTRTKSVANRVATFVSEAGIVAEAIHGNKSQSARLRALNNFKTGNTRVLVASDLAARGIDIEEVSHVINYDVPNVAETYVHRIGRTGRAANTGIAVSFCDVDERSYIIGIERLIKKSIPVVKDHPFPMLQTTPTPKSELPQRGGGQRRSSGGGGDQRSRRPGGGDNQRPGRSSPSGGRNRG